VFCNLKRMFIFKFIDSKGVPVEEILKVNGESCFYLEMRTTDLHFIFFYF
jgi:hypothetical protein